MLSKILYRKCRECGTPRMVSRMFRWGNDGTMGLKFRDVKREVIINASMFDDLVEEINRKIGAEVWHLVFEACRNVSRVALEDLFNSDDLLNKLKNRSLVRRLIIRFFHELSSLKGYCYSNTKEIKAKDVGTAYVKNPFNIYCIAGTIAAAFEAVDQKPYQCSWEQISENEFLIHGSPAEKKPEGSERLADEAPTIVEGFVKLERCPLCGMPERTAELFEWNRSEGTLTHRVSNDRFVSFVSTTIPPLFRELADELGDEIYDFLVTTQCEWTISHLDRLGITSEGSRLNPNEAKRAFGIYVDDFPVLGYGNPVSLEWGEESYRITVENPFFVEFIAGILLGLYNGLLKRDGLVSWESVSPGTVVYTLKGT